MVVKKILVIDDDRNLSFLLKSALDRSGYHTYIANNSKSGLEIAKVQQPDLILLDIRLPDINGVKLAKSLQSHAATGNIPVIFMTGILENDENHFKKYGIDIEEESYAVIPKPVDFAALTAKIRDLTEHRTREPKAAGIFSIFSKKGGLWKNKRS